VNCSVTDAHSNPATGSFTVTVHDTTKPVLTLPASINRVATSSAGAPASYSASATDIVDGGVPVTCTPTSGSTFAPGITTVNCSATDAHGNTQTGAFTVAVSFDLTGGLLPPVGKPGVINGVKAGSTVPLKWQVRNAAGGYITSTSIVSAFVLTRINCLTASSLDPVDFTTTGATVLRVSDNQFIQNWQTPNKPGNCYRVDIVFVGGSQTITATFQLK
jgi:HYR domain